MASFSASFVTAVLVAGCVNVQMYDGPEKSIAEIGRFFTDSPRPNLKILSIDEKPLSFAMTKVLHLPPGNHVFDVQANTMQVHGKIVMGIDMSSRSKHYAQGLYRIDVPIRSGYTYLIDYPINFPGPLPVKLCILGEPHQAPGSLENYTGEERKMSPKAEVVACGAVRDKKDIGS